MPAGSSRPYCVWTPAEEEALRQGVKKHGLGAWEVIRKDEEFSVLQNRTGVQLKDKFRNLVKFRHISAEESRTLKPKEKGPWSRKQSATAAAQRTQHRVQAQPLPPAQPDDNGVAEEHAATLLTLEGQGRPRSATVSEEPEDGQGNGMMGSTRRKRRRSLENRSFGIYDQRRYRADGTLRSPGDDDRSTTESEGEGGRAGGRRRSSGTGSRGARGRGRPRGRGRGRRRNVDDSETTTEEEDYADGDDENGEAGDEAMGDEEYIVDCPCGVRHDDGNAMVECEQCKTWAHIDCLQHQTTTNPLVTYDLEHYVCYNCQSKRAGMSSLGAMQPLAELLGLGAGSPGARANGHGSRTNGASRAGSGLLPAANGTAGLLGLANGASGLVDAPGGKSATVAAVEALGLMQGLTGTTLLAPALPADYMDTLSLLLRPSSALGNPGTSPRSARGAVAGVAPVANSPGKLLSNGSAGHGTAGGSAGGGEPGPASRVISADLDGAASSHNLDKLLAAASAQEAAGTSAGSGHEQPTVGIAAQPAKRTGSGSAPAGALAALSALARPASRGPGEAGHSGAAEDDQHHATLAHLMGPQGAAATSDVLLHLLAGANRSATPSQLFLEQIIRGTTPDLGLHPFLSNTMQGVAAAAQLQHGLAAAAQLQILHAQHGLAAADAGSAAVALPGLAQALQGKAGAPGGPDDLAGSSVVAAAHLHGIDALRPSTPDTWALLRGSTPTPDALALTQSLTGFTDAQWLLHRSSPALLGPTELAALAQTAQVLHQHQAAAVAAAHHLSNKAHPSGEGGSSVGPLSASKLPGPAPLPAGPAQATGGAGSDSKPGPGTGAGASTSGAGPGDAGANGPGSGEGPGSGPVGPGTAAQASGQEPVARSEQLPPAAEPQIKPDPEQALEAGAVSAATALAEAAATAAASAAASAVSAGGGNPGAVAAVMELVDRKASLGALGSAGDLAAAVAACCGSSLDEGYFNVEDMLRSSTPAPR